MIDQLKEVLEDSRDRLGIFYEPLYMVLQKVWWLIWPGSHSRMYWLYILSALAIGLTTYLRQHFKNQPLSFYAALRFCFPRSIYTNKSAIVDYKYYFVNGIVSHLVNFHTFIISSALVAVYGTSLLQHTFGPVESQLEAGFSVRLAYTILLILVVDMGHFIPHYLQHKVPFFWEFHKVHHSAQVLTPITVYRFHPMDKILRTFIQSIMVGIVGSCFGYLYKNGIEEITFTIVNVSIILFAFNLTSNLRHSHIWLSYGWTLSHVFCSPAMHQIHHSALPRHFDKNFAQLFSFWDYLAGTLYVPREKEELEWGLRNQEHTEYSGVWALYLLPLRKLLARVSDTKLLKKTAPNPNA